jgi:hypothetical protein
MALADDKRKVFTTISSYTSFMEQNKPVKSTDIFPSINNKKDVVPFLLDALKTIAGTDSLKGLIGSMITKVVASGETKIKEVLKKQFTQSNAGENLPTWFKDDGINIPVSSVDIAGKLKQAPDSDVGKLMYQKAFDVDRLFYDSIMNAGATVSFVGLNVDCKYDENGDSFNIKPPASFNGNIGQFFINYIENTQLVDPNEIVTNVMDSIYGTLRAKTKKTQAQVLQELQYSKILEQVMNDDDSMIILPKDYEELQHRALELSQGIVNYDMGCGLMPASLSFASLSGLNTTILGSTDPFLIGNAIENTIGESTSGNTTTEAVSAANKETIKDGFFQRLIKIFVEQMTFAGTLQPQIKMILSIMSAFQHDGVVVITEAATEYMKQFKIFMKCMVKDIMNMIAEYIFTLAIGYLIALLQPVIKKILKEKINQFMLIIKSLVGGGKVAALTNST